MNQVLEKTDSNATMAQEDGLWTLDITETFKAIIKTAAANGIDIDQFKAVMDDGEIVYIKNVFRIMQ